VMEVDGQSLQSSSIVKVDTRNYRKIAQENWGLSKEQMRGMHVHHRIRRCDGGTNDPSNLYVCSPSFHKWVWHDGEEFIEWSSAAGKKSHLEKDALGRSARAVRNISKVHSKRDEKGRSVNGVKAAEKIHADKTEEGKSRHAIKMGLRGGKSLHAEKDESGKSLHNLKLHAEKDEQGRSVQAMKTNSQVWESTIDGFRSTAGPVAQHNASRGWDPNARIRVE
jgi:hypothetical protein